MARGTAEAAVSPDGSVGTGRRRSRTNLLQPRGAVETRSLLKVRLRTERLLLRPPRKSDASALFEIFADPQVTRYLSRPAWTTLDQSRERIAQDLEAMAAGTYLRLVVVRRADRELIGECSLFNFVERAKRAEVGYALSRKSWGNGYLNEALRSFLEFAFSKLGLNRVEADIDPRNRASARSLERLGFTREGHLRQRWIVAGEVSDSDLYGLLRSDWRGGRV